MLLSIRKIFTNIKTALLFLSIGIAALALQLYLISSYGNRLNELKHQHLLIEKIVKFNTTDPQMDSILLNGIVAQLTLSLKLSSQAALFESLNSSNKEFPALILSLKTSSERFQNRALSWSSSLKSPHRTLEYEKMVSAQEPFLADLDKLIDYNIQIINDSIAHAKITALVLFFFAFLVFLRYRNQLTRIYADIDKACAIDINGEHVSAHTKEMDFVLKRLIRRSSIPSTNLSMTNPISGLNNQKGLLSAFNAKKSSRASKTVFLAAFEIDQYTALINTLSKEDIGNLFKKLGDIFALYEQSHDIIAHLEDDHLVFIMSRSNKKIGIEDCEKILHTVEASSFNSDKGMVRITLSGGFLFKIPAKSMDEAIEDAIALIPKAKENGGNQMAQLRDRAN